MININHLRSFLLRERIFLESLACPSNLTIEQTYDAGHDLVAGIRIYRGAGTAYSYAPFGNVSASENGVAQNFQWSSEFYDSELDLVYYNYRHYSPALGRFLSRDPIREQGGLNLYAFVGNATIHKSDILGNVAPCHCEDDCVKRAKKEREECLNTAQRLYERTLESLNNDYEILTQNIETLQNECFQKCQKDFEPKSFMRNSCEYACKVVIGAMEKTHYGLYFAAVVNNEVSFWGNKRQCENNYYLSRIRCSLTTN